MTPRSSSLRRLALACASSLSGACALLSGLHSYEGCPECVADAPTLVDAAEDAPDDAGPDVPPAGPSFLCGVRACDRSETCCALPDAGLACAPECRSPAVPFGCLPTENTCLPGLVCCGEWSFVEQRITAVACLRECPYPPCDGGACSSPEVCRPVSAGAPTMCQPP